MNSCRFCGHYITGGGCYKTGEQVKVDRNGSCEDFAGKDGLRYFGTINRQEDKHAQRLDDLAIEQYKQAGYILDLGA